MPQRHTIFERAMHLSPRNNTHSLMCPSTRVAADSSLLERCIARQEEMLASGLGGRWKDSFDNHPTRWDLADCDGLAARVDAEQCAWDGSWIPTFLAEFEQTRAFSVQLWMRAREGSFGMPYNFWPYMSFFSQLVSPETWMDMGMPIPTAEDMWIFDSGTGKRAEDGSLATEPLTWRHPNRLRPLRGISLSTEWTFMHFSFEEVGQGVRVCVAMNSRCGVRVAGSRASHISGRGTWFLIKSDSSSTSKLLTACLGTVCIRAVGLTLGLILCGRGPSDSDGGFCRIHGNVGIVLGEHFLEAIEFSTELMVNPTTHQLCRELDPNP